MTGNNKKRTARGRTSQPEAQGLDPEFDPVALAEKNFNRVLRALDALADDLHGREDSAVAKAAKLAGEARSAIQTIFNERQRLAKLDDDTSRALRAELDLDAARVEIGRRLALLRQRSGPAALSGDAE